MATDRNLASELLRQDQADLDEPKAVMEMIQRHRKRVRNLKRLAIISFFALVACWFGYLFTGAYLENVLHWPLERILGPAVVFISIGLTTLVILIVSAASWVFRSRELGTQETLACLVNIEQEIRQLREGLDALRAGGKDKS